MAYSRTNIPNSSNFGQDYYPLSSLPPTHNESDLLRPDASHASHDNTRPKALANNGPDSYFNGGQTLYDRNYIAPSLTESAPQHPSSTSTKSLYPSGLISNPLEKPNGFDIKEWQWEISAMIFSLVCFASVVGVLIASESKSLSSWSFTFGITLNTLIATLSTFSRTALLVPVASCLSQLKWIHIASASRPLNEIQIFDDASRGPWGSLRLVWNMHIKAKLATWGSLITILTLAMGPFAQQLLSFPLRPIYSDGAIFYTSPIYDSAPSMDRTVQGDRDISSTMGPKMQGAILNGLFNLSSPINVTCPTGSCQWPEFSTLAVTSACQNVTSEAQVNCNKIGGTTLCNYTTPAGFLLRGSKRTSSGGGSQTSYFNTTARVPLKPNIKEPPNSTILKIAMANMQKPFDLTSPELMECELRWCARVTQNLTVTNGTFGPGISKDIELTGVLSDLNQMAGRGQLRWYNFEIDDNETSFPGNRTFSIHSIDFLGIRSFLSYVFTADRDGPFFLPLMESSDRARTVASIAESMTYALGQSPSAVKSAGQTIHSEQYILVHWPWIILPLSEVVMTLAFMVCTLIHTHRMGVTVWKSSSIVPLLTVMVGWDNRELGATSLRDFDKRSKHMKGQLVPNSGSVQGLHRTG